MKVLFVTTCYPSKELSQYCVFLEQQAQALKKIGCTADVLVLYEGDDNYFVQEVYNGVDVIRLGIFGSR